MFLSSDVLLIQLSLPVFTLAAVTDWYDGWYARKYGFKTRWGQFLDPLADKILTSAAFVCFYFLESKNPELFGTAKPVAVWIFIIIIVFRDIILTLTRSIKELKGKDFRTSLISKIKTFIQMTYIFVFITCVVVSTLQTDLFFVKLLRDFLLSSFNYYILAIITLLTIGSGIAYIFESGVKPETKQ